MNPRLIKPLAIPKIMFLFLLMLQGCNTSKSITSDNTSNTKSEDITKKYTVSYRDDFKTSNEAQETAFLKNQKATSDSKSIILFTQGFKGEKIIAKQNNKTIYANSTLTNMKKYMADYFSFNNTLDVKIIDNFSKKEFVIPAEESMKHKYIYIKKELENGQVNYSITFSNSLRTL